MTSHRHAKHRLVEPPLATWRNTKLFHARDTRSLRGLVLRTVEGEELGQAQATLLNVIHQAVDSSHPVVDLAMPDLDAGQIHLTSDIWPGETLEHRLLSGPLSARRTLDVARNLAAGLATLHAKGLVHAGVHPANVWLAQDGGVRLLGLGLEGLEICGGIDALVASEAAYLSPEAVRGEPATPAADIWALGAIVCECLTGRRSVEGDETAEVLRTLLRPAPCSVPESLPADLRSFLGGALEPEIERRLPDGESAHHALLQVAEPAAESAEKRPRPPSGGEDAGAPAAEDDDETDRSAAARLDQRRAPSASVAPTRPLSRRAAGGRTASAPPRLAGESPVAVGQTIQGYRVTERLGNGGMGIVYRAHDSRLNRDVALKFLPKRLRNDERREDFEQEARAASALDHPNICTIFGIDETPEGDTFIAMACYDGPSLADRLEQGALPPEEALDIAEQLASGLAAAHEHGIVHRDVKPGNILFGRDGMAKIVDFGLSQIAEPNSGVRDRGELYGTIGYVAPEVVRSEPFDHRADIWALGVVLYEMLSGQRTFEGHGLGALYDTLERDPVPIGELVPGLSPEIHHVVHKATARRLEDRYQSAQALLEDLRDVRQANATREFEAVALRGPRLWAAAVAGILVIAAFFGLWNFQRSGGGDQPPERAALLGFTSAGAPGWVSLALEELMRLELTSRRQLLLADVPAKRRAETLARVDLPRLAAAPDPAAARPKGSGDFGWQSEDLQGWREVDTVLGGRVEAEDPSAAETSTLKISMVAQPVAEAKARFVTVRGEAGSLLQIAERLTDAGGFGDLRGGAREPRLAPLEGEARRLHDAAVERLEALDAPAAEKLCRQALEMTSHPGLRLLLAEALWGLGLESGARETLATDDSGNLPKIWRIYWRARALDFERAYAPAAALHRTLWLSDLEQSASESLPASARLQAAEALTRAGEPELALGMLDSLPSSDSVRFARATAYAWQERFDEALAILEAVQARASADALPFVLARAERLRASILLRLGRYEEGLVASAAAAELYEEQGSIRGQAEAAQASGMLLYSLGDMVRARDEYDRSARLYSSQGNQRAASRILGNKALVLRQQGDVNAQIEVIERALVLSESAGDQLAALILRVNLAGPLTQLARFEDAEQHYVRAVEVADEVDRFRGWARLRYGSFLIRAGRLPTGRRHLEDAREIFRRSGEEGRLAEVQQSFAQLLELQGDLMTSVKLSKEALETLRERAPSSLSSALRQAAATCLAAGDLEGAEKKIDEASGLTLPRVESNLVLLARGRMALARGELERASALTEEALIDLQLRRVTLHRGEALHQLAEIALARGQAEDALLWIEQARRIFDQPADAKIVLPPALGLRLDLTELRARTADDAPGTLEALQTLLAEVVAQGDVPLELETRLALGRAEIEADYHAAGGERLRALAEEASLKGFMEIALRARQAPLS
ncbi:MAG: protein kinase [Acidobacteriota bacterium]